MFNFNKWEMFYTVVKKPRGDSRWIVDQIRIDDANKRYILELGKPDDVTDGLDCYGHEIYSTGVSRIVFDIILNGVREKGFKECTVADI